jgi:hypothetical protein
MWGVGAYIHVVYGDVQFNAFHNFYHVMDGYHTNFSTIMFSRLVREQRRPQ